MANEIDIKIDGQNNSGPAFRDMEKDLERTQRELAQLAAKTDQLDSSTSHATGSLGGLASGFELLGLEGVVVGMENAALATDFFTGVGEGSTLMLQTFNGGLTGTIQSVKSFGTNILDAETKTGKFARTVAITAVTIGVLIAASQALSNAYGQKLNPQIEELADSLAVFSKNGTKSGEAARLLGKDFEHLSYDLGTLDSGFWAGLGNGVAGFVESLTGLGDVADESLKHAEERIHAIDQALAELVSQGRTEEASAAFNKLAEEATRSGVSVEELLKGLPEYAAAQSKAEKSTTKTTDAIRNQVLGLQDLADELHKQTDPIFALIDAQRDLTEKQKEYNEAVNKFGRNSPEARQALQDLTGAALDLADAATKGEQELRTGMTPALQATLKAAGLTNAQIEALGKQFEEARKRGEQFSKNYNATVNVSYKQSGTPPGGTLSSVGGFRGLSSGGISGAASGKIGGGLTWTGENGPELLDLPPGTQVHSNPDSMRMASQGMGGRPQQILLGSNGTEWGDFLVRTIFNAVRGQGGDPSLLGISTP